MRILLINTNTLQAPYPVPPVGLCMLAQRLSERFEIRVHDGMFRDPGDLFRTVSDFDPDVAGFGIRNVDDQVMGTPAFFIDTIARDFVAPMREASRARIVLGGSGFSLFPARILERCGADLGIVGEAEESFPALLDALRDGTDPSAIPGVVVRGQDHAPGLPAAMPPESIRPSNIDRWIDFAPYRARGAYAVQTKRGCEHRCIYCTYPCIEGSTIRTRDPAAVAREIREAAARLGDVTFEFVDSTFNDPPGHAERICEEIVRLGTRVRLRTMGMNPRGIEQGLLRAMRRAGFAQIDCTPDSASPRVIEALGKNFLLSDLEKAAQAIRDEDVPTMWFFIFGGPGEDEETFRQTLDFIDRWVCPMDMVYMAEGLRIYPGTRLHEIAIEQGVVGEAQDLLEPRFYVSPALGASRVHSLIEQAAEERPNCIPSWDSTPDEVMRASAARMRREQGLDEPMFRTFLRIRRARMEKRPA